MNHNCQTILQPPLVPVSACEATEDFAAYKKLNSDERRRLVLDVIRSSRLVSRAQIYKQLRISADSIKYATEQLVALGLVSQDSMRRTGGRAVWYFSPANNKGLQ